MSFKENSQCFYGMKSDSVQFSLSSSWGEMPLSAEVSLHTITTLVCPEWCGGTAFVWHPLGVHLQWIRHTMETGLSMSMLGSCTHCGLNFLLHCITLCCCSPYQNDEIQKLQFSPSWVCHSHPCKN